MNRECTCFARSIIVHIVICVVHVKHNRKTVPNNKKSNYTIMLAVTIIIVLGKLINCFQVLRFLLLPWRNRAEV